MRIVHSLMALAAVVVAAPAAAYGPKGHQMIGALADAQLTPAARAAVNRQLGYPLRVAAGWADCVRDVERAAGGRFVYKPDPMYSAACKVFQTPAGIDRMVDYARRNWSACADPSAFKGCHALYHFADVPVQQDHYDRAFAGTSDHDLVSALQAAIAKLQDKPVPAPFSIKDKAEAMLMLAHFVGDVHQPLHVGAVYLDAHDHPVDPGPPTPPPDRSTETRGGNLLEVGNGNLHSDWDGILASWDPTKPTPEILALSKQVRRSPGAPATWPKAWASETVKAARLSYAGLSYTHAGARKPGDWVVTFADRARYEADKNARQKTEMATAGARLAQVLNAVYP